MKYRPMSPHITIYNNESSSLYSIWHRITGIFNTFFIYFFILTIKMFNWGISYGFSYFLFLLSFSSLFFLNLLFLFFFYHMLNGCRHFSWDVNKFLGKNELFISLLTLLVGLIILILFSWILIF